MSLIYNATFDSQTRVLSLLDKAGNTISSCEVPSKSNELTLTATVDNSSVKLTKNGTLSNTYEVNVGSGWTAYEFGTVIPLNAGESCKWRCSAHPTRQTLDVYVQFVMTGKIEASGNVNSMLSRDFENLTSLSGYAYAFRNLFKYCKSLTKAPELPATELTTSCYSGMFYGCESLTKAPELPATYIYDYSYGSMFYNCTRLRKIHVAAQSSQSSAYPFERWVHNVNPTGDFYADPNMNYYSGEYGIPVGWELWVYGAEDTGTTTTRYHNGAAETVRVGTSSYGTCYSVQGWAGFKTPAGMHKAGYTLGAQTPITMYNYDSPVSAYSCAANAEDGFTETMYDVGDGTGYLTIAQQNANGCYLTATPYTGLTLTATVDNSSVKLSNMDTERSYQVNTGSGWQDYTFETVINLNSGDKCRWRCTKLAIYDSYNHFTQFVMTGRIEASGNCNSMLSSNYENITSLSNKWYAFCKLFKDCTSLTKAPSLPATTLAGGCYFYMFLGCSNLKEVHIFATTTASNALNLWLSGVSATGDFYCDPNATIFPTNSASGIPKGWNRRNIDLLNALTLTATADNSSVKLTKNGTLDNTFEVDTGNGWTAYEFDTVIPLNAGQSCKWRCSAHPTTQSNSNFVRFFMTGTIEASGNCNSMLSSDFENLTSLSGYDYAFRVLFYGCTSLTRAPSLPATTLVKSCYASMFYGCKALTRAPSLPATTLAKSCYASMFYGCTSLTRAPSLPATTLAEDCYSYMFFDCSNLNEVRISATTKASNALNVWLYGVSATGDFYCDPNATIFLTDSASGIPANWNRHALSDYPTTP